MSHRNHRNHRNYLLSHTDLTDLTDFLVVLTSSKFKQKLKTKTFKTPLEIMDTMCLVMLSP